MEEQLPFQFKFKEAGVDMSDMKKLDARQELLVITMEECGELIQECSKSIRMKNYNGDELKEELSDVMCMIELMIEYGIISKKDLSNGSQLKKMNLILLFLAAPYMLKIFLKQSEQIFRIRILNS